MQTPENRLELYRSLTSQSNGTVKEQPLSVLAKHRTDYARLLSNLSSDLTSADPELYARLRKRAVRLPYKNLALQMVIIVAESSLRMCSAQAAGKVLGFFLTHDNLISAFAGRVVRKIGSRLHEASCRMLSIL